MKKNNLGFSLLELAIVIAIIALVSGGIVAGRTVIRNAEIREALGEYDRHQKAIVEFQERYIQLPGDFNGATANWGTASNCNVGLSTDTPQKATCNGDGNGFIGDSNGSAGITNNGEWYRAWQHLANAGLIDGLYTGSRGAAGVNTGIVGTNIPASRLTGAGWTIAYLLANDNLSDTQIWADQYGHILMLGGNVATNTAAIAPVITPSEAFDMDNKVDDGKPSTGKMRARLSSVTPRCINQTGVQSTETYTSTSTSQNLCSIYFLLGF